MSFLQTLCTTFEAMRSLASRDDRIVSHNVKQRRPRHYEGFVLHGHLSPGNSGWHYRLNASLVKINYVIRLSIQLQSEFIGVLENEQERWSCGRLLEGTFVED
jgi:hypothetical protein